MPIILIDSGTTNSRLRLVENMEIKDVVKIEVGVRNTAIEGSNEKLKQKLSTGIKHLLKQNELVPEDIFYIIAAGMITSNLGIYEVPHIEAPAKMDQFVNQSKIFKDEVFLNIPCIFVPGMKNNGVGSLEESSQTINEFDIMRGEEVEAFGLLEQLNPAGDGLLVLPGSHTKFVFVNENRMLVSCLSTLGGELLKAGRDQTILSDAIGKRLITEILPDRLIEGSQMASKVGVTRSLYQIRLLQLFSTQSENERANYYTGAILQSDIEALKERVGDFSKLSWIIIGGSEPLKSVFTHLLMNLGQEAKILKATEEQVERASIYGAKEIGEAFQKKNQNIV